MLRGGDRSIALVALQGLNQESSTPASPGGQQANKGDSMRLCGTLSRGPGTELAACFQAALTSWPTARPMSPLVPVSLPAGA